MPKPKAKSGQEPKISLDEMLSRAATTNHLTGVGIVPAPGGSEGGQAGTPAPGPTPANEEQKGENVSETPAAETVAPVAPEPVATPEPEADASHPEPTASVAAPTPQPEPASAPESIAEAPDATAPALVATVLKTEQSEAAIPEPLAAVDGGVFDLASLFLPPSEKKTAQMRLTDSHYQYLLLLGTIVGGGATPPDIVHNLVQQFIDKHDSQVQKAISKQMRQRQAKK